MVDFTQFYIDPFWILCRISVKTYALPNQFLTLLQALTYFTICMFGNVVSHLKSISYYTHFLFTKDSSSTVLLKFLKVFLNKVYVGSKTEEYEMVFRNILFLATNGANINIGLSHTYKTFVLYYYNSSIQPRKNKEWDIWAKFNLGPHHLHKKKLYLKSKIKWYIWYFDTLWYLYKTRLNIFSLTEFLSSLLW